MLDIGWSEMLLIAVVAIVVIGPKDLPRALRTLGQWVGKARSIAREFQSSVDQMIADAELDEIKKTTNAIGDFKPDTYLQNQIDPTGPADDEAAPQDGPTTDDPAAGVVATGPASLGAGAAATAAVNVADGSYHPPQETETDEAGEDTVVPAGARARAGES